MGNCLPGRGVKPTFRPIVPNHTIDPTIPQESKAHPNHGYSLNLVKTTRYSVITFLPKNLFEQFHRFANIYFIFVVALNWIPQVNAFAKEVAALPVFFVLLVTALKDAFEDFRRYRSDKKVNNHTCRVYSQEERRYVKKEWSKISPGDFIHLSCNEIIPADILFIHSSDRQGICHIETSNLDGENNLKQRQIIDAIGHVSEDSSFPHSFTHTVNVEQPNAEIYSFKGYIDTENGSVSVNSNNLLLRGCIIRNTDFIEGLVVYAGPETKAMLNNKGPRYKISKLESKINRDVIWCVILLLFLCFFCAIGSGIWLADYNNLTDNTNLVPFIAFGNLDHYSPLYQGFIVFWTYIIIFQYIFSDKTGTLTENRMEFKSCTVGGVNYLHVPCDDDLDSRSDSYSHQSFTASSRTSSIVENLSLEPALQRELSNMCLRSLDSVELTIPLHVRRVQEFFLLMAVCNTVVVSYIHEDLMDDSGYIVDDAPANKTGPMKLPTKDGLEKPVINKMNLQSSTPTSVKSRSLLSLSVSESGDASESGSVAGSSFLSVGSQRMHYEAESPDELALVKAANTYGCKLTRRSPGKVTVTFPAENDEVELEVLNILHFDATRKRMSVIVRHPMTRNIILYVKGADSSILSVLHPKYQTDEDCKREVKNTQEHLDGYARKGLRTLCMAKRVLNEKEYQAWASQHKKAESDMNDRDGLVMQSCLILEKDLELLGATGIEDKLQEGVPATIANLRQAGIKVWVLTGDKQETAIQIANSCQLFSPDQTILTINASCMEETREALDNALAKLREDQKQLDMMADSSPSNMGSQTSLFSVLSLFSMAGGAGEAGEGLNHALVIDGKTLAFAISPELERRFLKICLHCRSVVCCRATPIQKASVVRLVRDNLKKMTLSIGDGANDVSMIQTADIGVGISGQEGMQAVMASDFAIAKFRFLERLLLVHGHWNHDRLLLVHGHWNHDRLCKFSAVMFYKSLITVFILFWFQIFSGFSGSLMIDSLYLTMQHVVFTSLPPLANGVFDKDLCAFSLLSDPTLYKPGQRGEMYTHWTYVFVLLDSLYQSLALYFIPHVAYQNHGVGLWEFGTTCDVCMIITILLTLCIETNSWVWIQWVCVVISFVLFWAFLLVSNAIFFTFDHPSNPYWVFMNTVSTASHSSIVILTVFVALLPR
ncbi:hypothetical protein EGW08_017882 [Elysia chlorotica]|uniref:Phospholipid-transporting ATPase n=1 Tax=Elysia chlorotica TaxID=188477 RepID=A0A433SYH0_ELYCH|nr:hypothetical protein EGW08_017882 [Elysia chlorotica]